MDHIKCPLIILCLSLCLNSELIIPHLKSIPNSQMVSTVSPAVSANPPLVPVRNISSVRIEENPQTQTPRRKTTPITPTKQTLSNNTSNSSTANVKALTQPVGNKYPTSSTKKRADPSLPVVIFNALDDIINKFVDPPVKPSVDPRHVLSKNFAPVDELPPTDCEIIQGSLPPCLDGAYIRNGPNPQFLPRGPYHLFDGDGMLHCIRISQGRATLCSRYVKTYKYKIEKEAGCPLVPNVFSGFNGLVPSAARGAVTAARVFTGQYNPVNGIGLANTSLAFFGNNLYALGESDLPYIVKLSSNGDVETAGRHDFDGKLRMSMTAHPKIDPETGETFAFQYGPAPPFLTYFHFDSNGKKKTDVPIFSVVRPSFLHDFAITRKYAIFADIQIGMNPMEMLFNGGSLVGSDSSKVPRLGVLPRYATDESEMAWFDVPGFNIIHAINAWDEDEGNTIVLIAPNIMSIEHALERMDLAHALVEKVKINLKTGIVTRNPISARNLDFAVLNPAYLGKKNKYVYAAVGDPMPNISGVVKLDVSRVNERKDCTVAARMYGPGCYGGEPFFVARKPEDPKAEEDDGYVVSYMHDENSDESWFLVMDAKSPELEIVAKVKLPGRVPYGFHGLFVRESDIRKTQL